MDVKCVAPFLDAVRYTLEQFGVADIKRGNIEKKKALNIGKGINSIVGIVGGIKGNIAYSMSEQTAKNIISAMMMGMPVDTIDDIGKSAIGELSNMITGHASVALYDNGYNINITPPVIMINVSGDSIVSFVETIVVDLETSLGKIQVNIGLEG
jgi:chemotaxis protein CheX